jgi:ribosomal protein S18 acetylase RimI-like enzyme
MYGSGPGPKFIRRELNRIMEEEYQIVYAEKPAWDVIGPGINAYNTQHGGEERFQHLCFVLQGPDEEIVGGVIGGTFWDWLHIDLMWIKEDLRGRGYGQRLLALAEEEARKRGAKNAFLDTFSFQAPGFYKKYGYQIFGELADFPPGHRRYYLTKPL